MPNRIIKESICVSGSIEELSWFEEVFFYRLIVNCDDFGRFDARPAVLRSRLFPLKDITSKQIDAALSKLATVGMVKVYEYDQQPYLQLENWGKHQSVRNKRSKYPDPISPASICIQLHANVPVIQSVSESVSESKKAEEEDARARDPFPTPPTDPFSPACTDPVDDACQRLLTEFIPCGLSAPNAYTQDEIITHLTLPQYGATLEAREGLVLRAMRAAGEGNAQYRTWSGVKGLIAYWLKHGEAKPDKPPARAQSYGRHNDRIPEYKPITGNPFLDDGG